MTLEPRFDSIPNELKDLPQWVVWKQQGEKKIPYAPSSGAAASVNDPSTWDTFEKAVAVYMRGGYTGIGWMFTDKDPYVGIDLDDCVVDGKLQPWTTEQLAAWSDGMLDPAEIVEQCGSYAEVSPSGTGVKIWVRGSKSCSKSRQGSLEIYDSGRFFTMTECAHEGQS